MSAWHCRCARRPGCAAAGRHEGLYPMSDTERHKKQHEMSSATDGACRDCVRRSWLLGKLGARLDYRSREESRLLELLELEDEQLIEAIAGRRRSELKARWERF